MKNFYTSIISFLFAILIFIGCSGDNSNSGNTKKENNNAQNSIVSSFIEDINTLEEIDGNTQIPSFVEEATAIAERVIQLDKENMPLILEKAKHYKSLVIIVEDHTIVKVTDLKDCKQSGAWNTCMPMGEGYIKKGELLKKKDYINNIIGISDTQERVAYLFN